MIVLIILFCYGLCMAMPTVAAPAFQTNVPGDIADMIIKILQFPFNMIGIHNNLYIIGLYVLFVLGNGVLYTIVCFWRWSGGGSKTYTSFLSKFNLDQDRPLSSYGKTGGETVASSDYKPSTTGHYQMKHDFEHMTPAEQDLAVRNKVAYIQILKSKM